jgi:hypothetical protein
MDAQTAREITKKYIHEQLKEVKNYMDVNNKRPSVSDKDQNIKTSALWIGTQLQSYKKNRNVPANSG